MKFLLTTMKPLHAKWLIDSYNEMSSEACREVILSGWRQSGILDAVALGSNGLSSLDPFHDIDNVDFNFNSSNVDIDPQLYENYKPVYINKREKVGATEISDSESGTSGSEEY